MNFGRSRMLVALALLAMPVAAYAQDPKPVTPAFDFSGVILPQYRYTYDDATKNANGGLALQKFDIERVYLNFRMPAGEDGSIRVTTDVFNNSISSTSCVGCYNGWNIRLKYAYFQYNYLHNIGGSSGFNATARIGMLHTAVIDHEEGFWPRFMSQTAVERNGFFSSSDLGIATVITLPKKWGEVYATVANGTGYSAVEADPYKDWSARLSLTPFGNESGIMKTFTLSPWFYLGKTASKFLTTAGSSGNSLTDGNTKNREGIFIGLKDRKLTAGLEWAQREETIEGGTTIATRTTLNNKGTLTDGFVIVRPFELFNDDPKAKSRFGLVFRMDTFKPFDNATQAGAQTTSAKNTLTIAGLMWDLNSKATFSIDMQDLKGSGGSTQVESKILFMHWNINF